MKGDGCVLRVLPFLVVVGALEWACAEHVMTDDRVPPQRVETATFAGGCFWCMEPPFEHLAGVQAVISGYTGGTKLNPTYEEVCSGTTGHAEAVQVAYDPAHVTYAQLLEVFWRNVDPTTPNQQFADRGTQYRTAVFTHSEEQRRLAEESKQRLEQSGKFERPIVTEIVPASTFYPAEEHHQDYSKKHPLHYKLYRLGSGREGYLRRTWGHSLSEQ